MWAIGARHPRNGSVWTACSEVLPQLTNEHYEQYAEVLQAGGEQDFACFQALHEA